MTDSPLRVCILAAASAIEESRDELTRLDSVAGDGDHGVSMTLAARATRRALDAAPDSGGADLFRMAAQSLASVGGAFGPLSAAALLGVADTVDQRTVASRAVTTEDLVAAAEAAEAAITELGGARPGAKTILDALHPAVEALRRSASEDADPHEGFAEAAAAARAGALATSDMVATIGRASRLGERSRGSPDAGAVSLAIVLEAAAAAYGRGVSGKS